MSLDEATWAEIARLWREGREPLGAIAARFGTSHQRIAAVARSRQWPRRGGATGRGAGRPADRGGGSKPATHSERQHGAVRRKPKARSRAAALQHMVERLFDAMETKLSAIEQRMADGGDDTPADSERTARSLGTLIRNLERLSEYERKLHKLEAAAGAKSGGERDDTERRRQELARRIEALLDRR